ncbi:MAG: hypothetical protein Q7J65_04250 [Candidatus Marinimicrobia bacterium]|nr:hypothetical protein [Candidatus Neomarinimicrobiota bacterium]
MRWPHVRLDLFGDINEMDNRVMDALNELSFEAVRRYAWNHTINSDFRAGDTGQHGAGMAIDFVFFEKKPGDVPVIDQFIFTVGYGRFRRVGLYPHWKNPGLHGDVKDETLYWWRDKAGKYHYGQTPAEILTWK